MWEKTKNFIETIDRFAQYIANFTIFTTILLATAYFVYPDLRRFVETNLTNRSAWYMYGTLKLQENTWEKYVSANEAVNKTNKNNFYHISTQEYYGRTRNKITIKMLKDLSGNIVVQNVNYPVMGRALEDWIDGNAFRSDNEIASIAKNGECFYVWEVNTVDGLANELTDNSPNKLAHVWIRATKINCD